MILPFIPASVGRVLVFAVAVVQGASLVFLFFWYAGHGHMLGFGPKFDPRYEVSVPTWLATTVLAACAVTLATISSAKRQADDRFWLHWRALAAGFLILSIDEAAALHEHVLGSLSKATLGLNTPTQLWAIFGLGIALVVGVAFLRFLFHLPVRARKQFLFAGALFIGGGALIELLSVPFLGRDQEAIALTLAFFEETFEITGVSFFLYSLFDYASSRAAMNPATELRSSQAMLR